MLTFSSALKILKLQTISNVTIIQSHSFMLQKSELYFKWKYLNFSKMF